MQYNMFGIQPNIEALRKFREEYINNFSGDLIYKITSRSDKWFKYKDGIYSPSKLSIACKPIYKKDQITDKNYGNLINLFCEYDALDQNMIKAFKSYYGENDTVLTYPQNNFFYLFGEPEERGVTYSTTGMVINEDLYNMAMINSRSFYAVTTPDDLSRYSEFFTVSDQAIAQFNFTDEYLEDLWRCGKMSTEEIQKFVERLDIEKQAVLSLRHK